MPFLVVPSMSNNVVTVLDLESHQVVKHVSLPKRGPSGAFASPDGRKVYCLASGGCDVVVLDVATWTVDRAIPVGGMIIDRGTVPDSGVHFWVAVILQGHIHRVNTETGQVTSFPKAGPCFQISGDEQVLFTLDQDKRRKPGHFQCRSVETGEVLGEVATPAMTGFPLGMWRSGSKVYWTELAKAGALHVMDVSDPSAPTYVKRIALGSATLGASLSPDGFFWIPNSGDGTVAVVDAATDQLVHTLDVNHWVGEITFLDGKAYLNQLVKRDRPGFWKSMWYAVGAPFVGVYVTKRSGNPRTRRVLDVPAEVVAYDATTFERLALPAMPLPSLAFTSAVVVTS
jgi:DNA-binding beta-propeller fold protein YncE